MKKILVTKKGFRTLEKRRLKFIEKLKDVQGQKGEAAAIGGNAWHDNFAFEDLVRQENMLNKQIQDAGQIIRMSVIVSDVPQGTKILQIGHIAHLYIENDDMVKVVMVGGFGESDLDVDPPIIDYSAPILKPFYGHEEGYEAIVQIGGVNKSIVLKTIELRSS